MNPNKTIAKAKKKASKNTLENLPFDLHFLLLRLGEDEEIPHSREPMEKLLKGSEGQSAIARRDLKKKHTLDSDIEQPTADRSYNWELPRKSGEK